MLRIVPWLGVPLLVIFATAASCEKIAEQLPAETVELGGCESDVGWEGPPATPPDPPPCTPEPLP
jgi:hypothetical protein